MNKLDKVEGPARKFGVWPQPIFFMIDLAFYYYGSKYNIFQSKTHELAENLSKLIARKDNPLNVTFTELQYFKGSLEDKLAVENDPNYIKLYRKLLKAVEKEIQLQEG